MSLPAHNYTVTVEAQLQLYRQFKTYTEPTRQAVWFRRPTPSSFADGSLDPNTARTYLEGLGWALSVLARDAASFDAFIPMPESHPYLYNTLVWYNPPDYNYLQEPSTIVTLLQATNLSENIWDSPKLTLDKALPSHVNLIYELRRLRYYKEYALGQEQGRYVQGTLNQGYSRLHLRLTSLARDYYHKLRVYFGIPLLPDTKHSNSLTASVSAVLEAIGTDHLQVPADFLMDDKEPNFEKARLAKQRQRISGAANANSRKYGNHTHEPYRKKEWRSIPPLSEPAKWTQEDVDYCANDPSLSDIAILAIQARPDLALPSTPTVRAEQDRQLQQPTKRKKGRIQLPRDSWVESQSAYLYKERDVSKLVELVHELHYTEQLPYSSEQIQLLVSDDPTSGWNIPVQAIRGLVAKEHVRRMYSVRDV